MPLNHTNRIMKWDDIDDSALVQLVYVSTLTLGSRLSTSIFDEVEGHARNYNQQHNITGTLCYGNGHFLQCIEGKKSDVFNLQERIFFDSHQSSQLCRLAYAFAVFGALVMVTRDQETSRTIISVFTLCAARLVI